ncbi:MAG: hypothetical protein WA160_02350, partial [Pseudobdellovibrio sp.]
AKRLNKTEHYSKIMKDIEKIEAFSLRKTTPEYLNPSYKNVSAYGLIVAMLCCSNEEESEKYKDYWIKEKNDNKNNLHAELKDNFERLGDGNPVIWAEPVWGSRIPEYDIVGEYSKNSTYGYILFFLFKRKSLRGL